MNLTTRGRDYFFALRPSSTPAPIGKEA